MIKNRILTLLSLIAMSASPCYSYDNSAIKPYLDRHDFEPFSCRTANEMALHSMAIVKELLEAQGMSLCFDIFTEDYPTNFIEDYADSIRALFPEVVFSHHKNIKRYRKPHATMGFKLFVESDRVHVLIPQSRTFYGSSKEYDEETGQMRIEKALMHGMQRGFNFEYLLDCASQKWVLDGVYSSGFVAHRNRLY